MFSIIPRDFVGIVEKYLDVDSLLLDASGMKVLEKRAEKWLGKMERIDSANRGMIVVQHRLKQYREGKIAEFFQCIICQKSTEISHRQICRKCRSTPRRYDSCMHCCKVFHKSEADCRGGNIPDAKYTYIGLMCFPPNKCEYQCDSCGIRIQNNGALVHIMNCLCDNCAVADQNVGYYFCDGCFGGISKCDLTLQDWCLMV